MDVCKLEQKIAQFQARARGYLVRKEVRLAREDFEEIVAEIDGDLKHLRWRETVISNPDFTDTCLQPSSSTWRPPDPEVGVGVFSQRSEASSEEGGDNLVISGKMEAERDYSHTCSTVREKQRGGSVTEGTEESRSTWNLSDRDLNYDRPYKGVQQYCLAQDVASTPEALRLHRNTLTMELLWLQQAIDSRKKYLSLKDRLSVS
ncbi:IQ domain-containing protein C [Gouania willdenowi]|uniref:IQ domain-containing protein C n=1 Tax=Gouania willdenowi TaxID=441366 RepID=UPI00105417DC|nr:IQ domain-containing protein C [Gouania willdenowi]